MATKSDPWVYGKSPIPRTWHEAAETIKTIQTKSDRKKGPGLLDRLAAMETLLKEKK
jgi:hypothetical protein